MHDGEQHHDQGGGHQHLPDLLIKLQMETQGVGNGSSRSQRTDDLHLLGDLMGLEFVASIDSGVRCSWPDPANEIETYHQTEL